MTQRILDHPEFAATNLSSLVSIMQRRSGPARTGQRAVAAPHIGFLQLFDQTQTLDGYAMLLPPEHRDQRAGSVGKVSRGRARIDPLSEQDGRGRGR
jgi:long-chain acyl-CoA synthetase